MKLTATGATTDPLVIGGRELGSRLLLGTGGFRSLDALGAAIEASATALVTVALRRIDPSARGSIVDVLDAARVRLPTPHRPARLNASSSTVRRTRRPRSRSAVCRCTGARAPRRRLTRGRSRSRARWR